MVNHPAVELLDEWLADESGYDEETWPELAKALGVRGTMALELVQGMCLVRVCPDGACILVQDTWGGIVACATYPERVQDLPRGSFGAWVVGCRTGTSRLHMNLVAIQPWPIDARFHYAGQLMPTAIEDL